MDSLNISQQKKKLMEIKKERAPKLTEILNLYTISEEAEKRELRKSINNNYELKRIEHNFNMKTKPNAKFIKNYFNLLKNSDSNYLIKKKYLKDTILVSDEKGIFRMTLPKELYKDLYENQKINYNERIISKYIQNYPNTTKNKDNKSLNEINYKNTNYIKSFQEIYHKENVSQNENNEKIIIKDDSEDYNYSKEISNYPINILKNSNDEYDRVKINLYNNKLVSNFENRDKLYNLDYKKSNIKEKNISFTIKLKNEIKSMKCRRSNLIFKIDNCKKEKKNIT